MQRTSIFPRLRYPADWRSLGLMALALVLLGGAWSGLLRHPAAVTASWLMAFVCCIITHNHSILPDYHRDHIVPKMDPALDHRSFACLLVERLRRPLISHAR